MTGLLDQGSDKARMARQTPTAPTTTVPERSPTLGDYAPIRVGDPIDWSLFPEGFRERFDVRSYRNALRILSTSSPAEFGELVEALNGFTIATETIVRGGGNKSRIAKDIEALFHPLGWRETRVSADLLVTRTVHTDPTRQGRNAPREHSRSRIPGFVDGHKIDFVKNAVAFDLEWNSKDQTFDRDLYAIRSFYETGIIEAGILLTRSEDLIPVFNELKARQPATVKGSKFGASTTWMGKLEPRLTAGRAGGCPVLAIGMRAALVTDFEPWKQANPRRQAIGSIMAESPDGDEAET